MIRIVFVSGNVLQHLKLFCIVSLWELISHYLITDDCFLSSLWEMQKQQQQQTVSKTGWWWLFVDWLQYAVELPDNHLILYLIQLVTKKDIIAVTLFTEKKNAIYLCPANSVSAIQLTFLSFELQRNWHHQ